MHPTGNAFELKGLQSGANHDERGSRITTCLVGPCSHSHGGFGAAAFGQRIGMATCALASWMLEQSTQTLCGPSRAYISEKMLGTTRPGTMSKLLTAARIAPSPMPWSLASMASA